MLPGAGPFFFSASSGPVSPAGVQTFKGSASSYHTNRGFTGSGTCLPRKSSFSSELRIFFDLSIWQILADRKVTVSFNMIGYGLNSSFLYQMKKIIITIDGWSSCGKSTLAKQLAKELGYVYIDSGAMYRAITLHFLRNHIDWTNAEAVDEALKDIVLEFVHNEKSKQSEMFLNGENVDYVFRDLVVAEKVSDVASIKGVREFAVAEQQKMGTQKGIVMDGRDIGTVVFPNAELKIFMTADNDIRVERRFR